MPKEIDYLISGHQKFREQYFEHDRALYDDLLKKGQKPRYIVISCSDSRVDPSILMNCQPGDLFVIRNVANLVPPCEMDSHYHGTSAALEFGICGLEIKHVIILGHSHCSGIMALLERHKRNNTPIENSFLSKWMELANSACQYTLSHCPNHPILEQADMCGKRSILNSLENLNTFSWITERVKNGSLFLHAWYFDLSTGKINFFNPKQQKFEVLDL